jgi:hypothetical protein
MSMQALATTAAFAGWWAFFLPRQRAMLIPVSVLWCLPTPFPGTPQALTDSCSSNATPRLAAPICVSQGVARAQEEDAARGHVPRDEAPALLAFKRLRLPTTQLCALQLGRPDLVRPR